MSNKMSGIRFWFVVGMIALLCASTGVIVGSGLHDASQPGSGFMWKDATVTAASLASALVASVALLVSMWNTERTVAASDAAGGAQRQRETNKAELARIEALVATFHVPYLVRSLANKNMAQDLRKRLNDPNYRLLLSLFDPTWLGALPRADRTIVREICATGIRLKSFIEDNAGGVDPTLAEHLARASTHFRILWLAYRRRLGEDGERFRLYVYPEQLDVALRADLDRLKLRIEALRAEPEKAHGPSRPLAAAQRAPRPLAGSFENE